MRVETSSLTARTVKAASTRPIDVLPSQPLRHWPPSRLGCCYAMVDHIVRYRAFGTPGGDQQDQWVVPFLINHLVHSLDLQAAIDTPNWHTTHVPSSFYPRQTEPGTVKAESRLGESTIAALRSRGHSVDATGPWSLGRLGAASFQEDGILMAAANPRGMQGYAAGR